jgi:DNA-binding Lrp family transcriptional regulator
MEKDKFITGYHAFIDVSKIGINSTLVLLKTRATQSEKEKYIQKISTRANVYSLVEIIGEFDIALGVYSKSEKEKNEVLDGILDGDLIKDFEICEITTKFPRMNYTEEMFKNFPGEKVSESKIYEIDSKDKKILLALSKNCRTSSVDLAEELKLPRGTINYRINKMIESGIIAKFQPNVNFFMLETEFYFLKFKLLKPSEKNQIERYLSETLRANTILESDGTYQIMAFLQFKNNSEFREFEEKLLDKFGKSIQDYSFNLAKFQHKLEWFPKGI